MLKKIVIVVAIMVFSIFSTGCDNDTEVQTIADNNVIENEKTDDTVVFLTKEDWNKYLQNYIEMLSKDIEKERKRAIAYEAANEEERAEIVTKSIEEDKEYQSMLRGEIPWKWNTPKFRLNNILQAIEVSNGDLTNFISVIPIDDFGRNLDVLGNSDCIGHYVYTIIKVRDFTNIKNNQDDITLKTLLNANENTEYKIFSKTYNDWQIIAYVNGIDEISKNDTLYLRGWVIDKHVDENIKQLIFYGVYRNSNFE